MNAAELREMTTEELYDALLDAKEERFNLRFQVATNQLDNTARLTSVKKDIARILTILREREESPGGDGDAGVAAGASANTEGSA